MLRKLYRFYRNNYWGINGALVGLALGLSLVFLGLLKTIILAVCILAGYFVGRMLQKDKNFLKNLLDKILPPGSYR
ncbi:MAG: DUF2273 domain-containing protein [Ruminococcaceae bacterium]|nr:DUF2273 domain-containing protein [Oscillospiraceae bacterium]